MKNLKIATAQFENKSGDKNNLSVIEKLSQKSICQRLRCNFVSRVFYNRIYICKEFIKRTNVRLSRINSEWRKHFKID
jgi:hypothetical protein